MAFPGSVAVGRDGSLYLVDGGERIRRVTPDGIIRTIAGSFVTTGGTYLGVASFADGIPPRDARLSARAVALGADDTVYVASEDARIRWFRPGGVINTIAGLLFTFANGGDDGPARRASLEGIGNNAGLALGPDASIYLAQQDSRVRRIAPIVERFVNGELIVPAYDGSEIFVFTQQGQHLRTLDSLTGALRYQFTYDARGQLASITDGSANVTTVERDSMGMPTGILSPFGQRTLLDLDANGYLSEVTNPATETVQLVHTTTGLMTGFTRPGRQSSGYGFDPIGRLISATDPTGATKTLTRAGTNKDHTITLRSELGRVRTYRTARLSNGDIQLTTTDAAGAQSQWLIAQNGTQASRDRDGTTMALTLGPDPRWGMRAPIPASLTIATPNGLTWTITATRSLTLASAGDLLRLATQTDTITTNGRSYTTTYSGATGTLTQTTPTGLQESVTLDSQGRPAQAQFGSLVPTTYSYDARGRLEVITDGTAPNNRITTLGYGIDGFLASVDDSSGRTIAVTTDANGRITELTGPDGEIIRYDYDENSNLRGLTPPDHPQHLFGFAARDEISSYIPPVVGGQSSAVQYRYDDDRMLDEIENPDGQTVDFVYDAAGRLSLIDLASGQLGRGYDSASRLQSVTTPLTSLIYSYDSGLTTGATSGGAVSGSVSHVYDNNFLLTSQSVNGANALTLQYNDDYRLIAVGSLTLTRNQENGLITGSTLGSVTDQLGYNGFGEMTSYSAAAGATNLYSSQHTRDGLGRITQTIETMGGGTDTFDYTYDLAGRLETVRQNGALTATYTYDANGNRLTGPSGTTTYASDDQDRLVTSNGPVETSYVYTPNGELQSKTTGDDVTLYHYDGVGNLVRVTLPAGMQIDYVIDGLDRRVGKRVNGALVKGLLYEADDAQGIRPAAELAGNGTLISRFVYASGVNVPAYMLKGATTYRIITDHVGSPRLVVNAATGAVAQQMDYDEFGNVTNDTSPGFQPFGFAGGLYDPETALTHFGAREYDAQIGRWTRKDPIGFGGGDSNLYAYGLGDPVNQVDPLGLNPVTLPLISEEIFRKHRTTALDLFREYVRDNPATGVKLPTQQELEIAEGGICAGPLRLLGWFVRLFKPAPKALPPPKNPLLDEWAKQLEREFGKVQVMNPGKVAGKQPRNGGR